MTWLHIAKEFKFEAGHQLNNPAWGPKENALEFGKCASQHGHSYKIEVQVGGRIELMHGWVMDYADLKDAVHLAVINQWDHKFLNDLPPFNDGEHPTTAENIAVEAFKRIEPYIPRGIVLERVRVKETASTFAEVTR